MAECRECVHCKHEERGVYPWRYENPGRCANPAGEGYIVDIDFPWCSRIVTKRHEELVAEADTLLTAIPGVSGHTCEIRNGTVGLVVHTRDEGLYATRQAVVKAKVVLIDKFPEIEIDMLIG